MLLARATTNIRGLRNQTKLKAKSGEEYKPDTQENNKLEK